MDLTAAKYGLNTLDYRQQGQGSVHVKRQVPTIVGAIDEENQKGVRNVRNRSSNPRWRV